MQDEAFAAHIQAQSEIRSRDNQGWARWLARSFDVLLAVPLALALAFPVGVLFTVLGGDLEAVDIPDWLTVVLDNDIGLAVVEGAVGVVLGVVIEGIFVAAAGTTPGKWIMGIRIRRLDGRRLGILAAFGRAFGAHGLGIAFGIPVLSLIAVVAGRAQLKERGATVWEDLSGGYAFHRNRPVAVWCIMIPLVILGNAGMIALSRMA